MIELIQKNIQNEKTQELKIHKTREYLQILALKILNNKGYFKNLAFLGGTALRIIHNLQRFSDDLDFSLIKKQSFNFEKFCNNIKREFTLWGLLVDVKVGREKNVRSALLKFKDILFKLKLSPIKDEKLSIRLEIDQNPPRGWNTEICLISKEFVFSVVHFDLPSMFATKIHACFYRKYVKGRDFYDFFWYLGKKILPNFRLLNNAISQTEGINPKIHQDNFKDFLLGKIKDIDFNKLRKDVEPFLIDKGELELFSAKMINTLL